MRYLLAILCLFPFSALADEYSNYVEQRDEQIHQEQVMEQQITQIQQDRDAAQESAALHAEFNQPVQSYQQPEIQYVPAGNDPNPPSGSLMY